MHLTVKTEYPSDEAKDTRLGYAYLLYRYKADCVYIVPFQFYWRPHGVASV